MRLFNSKKKLIAAGVSVDRHRRSCRRGVRVLHVHRFGHGCDGGRRHRSEHGSHRQRASRWLEPGRRVLDQAGDRITVTNTAGDNSDPERRHVAGQR